MNPVVDVLVTTLEPAVAVYLAGQLKPGTKVQDAVDNTVAKLADLIPIPALHPKAEAFLTKFAHALEAFGITVIGGTPDAGLASGSTPAP